MKLKHLEAALSSLTREFPNPKVNLEQYPTSAHLVACVIQLAVDNGDLGEDTICLDLGCGTGMLSVGAAFVCPLVIAVDCDQEAITVAMENVASVDLDETVQFLRAQVRTLSSSNKAGKKSKSSNNRKGRGSSSTPGSQSQSHSQSASDTRAILILDGHDGIPLADNSVDTVITNPPFGTKDNNQGVDVQFLRTACRLARRAVYSFHKRTTRDFLIRMLHEWGYPDARVVAELAFDIPKTYRFHNQTSKDVPVDLIRVVINDVDELDDRRSNLHHDGSNNAFGNR